MFLDRDGVVNKAVIRDGVPYPPECADAVELTPNAHETLGDLKRLGFLLLVVTNQPDVRRGSQDRRTVEGIHQLIRQQLPIDDFFVCYHDDRDHCDCRKPKPGLILQAAERYDVNLAESYLIGDRWRDIDAGRSAGCKTIWIDCGYSEKGPTYPPDARVASLGDAVAYIRDLSTG